MHSPPILSIKGNFDYMGMLTGMIVGAGIGLAAINVMALIAKNSGHPHDLTTLSSDEDVFAKVQAWAQANGYYLANDVDQTRLYRKGKNFLTAPMFLEVSRDGRQYTFKSYTQINGFILKGDMALTGNSFVAKLPRSMAKKAQNTLFASLGLPSLP